MTKQKEQQEIYESHGEPAESNAANLWESMADPNSDECADTNAAVVYLESVLPRADIRMSGPGFIQLDYKGMEYIVGIHYNFPGGGYLQFFNKQSSMVDLDIDCDTENPDEQVRKLFESPDSPGEPSLQDIMDRLEALMEAIKADLKEIHRILKK
jgi:hypothetical protein